jgi:beta-phosphoglucomutase
MKIKACVFDLDGVIVNTAPYHFQSWKRIADSLGIPFDEQDNEHLKGISRQASLDHILSLGPVDLQKEQKQMLADEKNSGYLEGVKNISPNDVLPGVKEFLSELAALDIPIGLGSSSKNADLILLKTGLSDFFQTVVDGNSPSPAKPDPAIFLKAAHELGVHPSDTVVFEDSIAGVNAARAGGFRSVGLGSAEVLGNADLVLKSMEGLSVIKLEELLD